MSKRLLLQVGWLAWLGDMKYALLVLPTGQDGDCGQISAPRTGTTRSEHNQKAVAHAETQSCAEKCQALSEET